MAAKIVVVDHQTERRDRVIAALGSANLIHICGGVQEAMDLFKGGRGKQGLVSPCDLILCAVYLDSFDKLTVFDLLKWAKKNEQLKTVPFVLLDIEPGEIARLMVDAVRMAGGSMGALEYLVINKFDAVAFKETVDGYLQQGDQDEDA